MAAKVDEQVYKRILELRALGLTNEIIGIRLGISARTVRVYTRAARLGLKAYEKPEKENVQP